MTAQRAPHPRGYSLNFVDPAITSLYEAITTGSNEFTNPENNRKSPREMSLSIICNAVIYLFQRI